VLQRFILITIILAFLSWTGLSREVRGKVLAYRNNDYSNAAIATNSEMNGKVWINSITRWVMLSIQPPK
jgi:ABC-type dipeptide/oligopeptide/nickel transport system permease subunit